MGVLKSRLTGLDGPPEGGARPVICLIPGGPGLSSRTLAGMEVLRRSFDLAFVDPPGTGGLPEVHAPSFLEVVESICKELATLKRPLVLCGHSFGGLYAIQCLASPLRVAGLALMNTPMLPQTYAAASGEYEKHKTPRLLEAGAAWEANPGNDSFRRWVASYGPLYFSGPFVEKGREMLLGDLTSYQSCQRLMGLMKDPAASKRLIGMACGFSGAKFLIAGDNDLLFTSRQLAQDARAISADYHVVAPAGHFPAFEKPDAVADIFERYFRSPLT